MKQLDWRFPAAKTVRPPQVPGGTCLRCHQEKAYRSGHEGNVMGMSCANLCHPVFLRLALHHGGGALHYRLCARLFFSEGAVAHCCSIAMHSFHGIAIVDLQNPVPADRGEI